MTNISNSIAITDSCTIIIPKRHCKIKDIDSHTRINMNKVYHDDYYEYSAKFNTEINGITSGFSIGYDAKNNEQVVKILVNAKQVQSGWQKGITLETLQSSIYPYISNTCPDLVVSLDAIINKGKMLDTDFALDKNICLSSEFHKQVSAPVRKSMIDAGINSGRIKQFKNKHNSFTGIQLDSRNSNNSDLLFFKMYHKYHELQTDSNEFYNQYAKNADPCLVRTELNYKSRKSLIATGIVYDNSVLSLLENPNTVNELFKHGISKIIGFNSKTAITIDRNYQKEMTAQQRTYLNIINEFIESGKDLHEIQKIFVSGHNERTQRNLRNVIEDLYNKAIQKEYISMLKFFHEITGIAI